MENKDMENKDMEDGALVSVGDFGPYQSLINKLNDRKGELITLDESEEDLKLRLKSINSLARKVFATPYDCEEVKDEDGLDVLRKIIARNSSWSYKTKRLVVVKLIKCFENITRYLKKNLLKIDSLDR